MHIATVTATAISAFMFIVPWRSAIQPCCQVSSPLPAMAASARTATPQCVP